MKLLVASMKWIIRRFVHDTPSKALQSVPTLRSKPRIDVGWNDFAYHLKNLLKTEFSESSLKAFFLPLLSLDRDSQLFNRWLQTFVILPLFRETMVSGFKSQAQVQAALEFSRVLRPYLVSVEALGRVYKWPLLQSLDKFEGAESRVKLPSDSFVIGKCLLVAPIANPSLVERYVYLPSGDWYSYSTFEYAEGKQYVLAGGKDGGLPVFIKAGTSLPLHFADEAGDTLVYRIFPGNLETVLYEGDMGVPTNGTGDYRWIYMVCAWDEENLIVTRRMAGQYKPPYAKMRVEVVGLAHEPVAVQIDRRPAPLWYFDSGILEFTTESFQRIEIQMRASNSS